MAVIPNTEETSPLLLPTYLKNLRSKNWALDQRVAERIRQEVGPVLKMIRDRRRPLNALWESYFKVWSLEHDGQGYLGTSNIYLPSGQRNAETLCSQLVSGTFPGEDNFGVEAWDPQWADNANYVKTVLKHQIDNVARVRVAAEPFYRQLLITGNSPVKVFYERRTIPGKRRARTRYMLPEDSEYVLYDGPVFETLDMGNLYIWPENVNSPKDAEIIFEDLTVTMAMLKRKALKNELYSQAALEKMSGRIINDTHDHTTVSRLQAQGFSSPHEAKNKGWGLADITECYLMFDPDAEDRDSETNPVPFLITLCDNEPLRAIRNPFWHQRPPYLVGRMKTVTGRVYGTGVMDGVLQLQRLLNDQVNLGQDASIYSLNPIIQTNVNAIVGALPDLEPGVQLLVTDINNAMKFTTPPSEVINNTSILTAQTQNWMQEVMGTPPVLTGGSAPGRAFKTATGIGTAQRNASIPIQEIIRLCEAEVWEPMLHFFNVLNEQFGDRDFLVYMMGGKGVQRIGIEQLLGDWMFNWLASTQTDNKTTKGSQIMELIQILSNPTVIQLFQANQLMINPGPLIKRLYEEVYGWRDVDKVILNLPPMQLQGPGQPPAPGQPQAPAPTGPPGAEPGQEPSLANNGDFQATRQNSDQISSMLGGLTPSGMGEPS